MKNNLAKYTLSLFTIIALSGCTKLGPNFNGVENLPIPQKWSKDGDNGEKAISQWWKIFNDKTLNTLIEKSYTQNLDIKSAGLRILQARAVLGISEGLSFPQVQTLSGSMASTNANHNNIKSAGLNFDMGWEMDVWGKYARGVESSEANLYASVASYSDIMVSVISEVARNYIEYRTSQERLAYAVRNVTIQERVTVMTEVQFNSGNVSELDMQQARTQLYNTRSAIPVLELSKIKSRNAIALLLGEKSTVIDSILHTGKNNNADSITKYIGEKKRDTMQIKQSKSDMLNIAMIPVANINPYSKIDAELIRRRPDIKVAEYLVRSNNAKIGMSIADLYPSFSLFGNIGLNSNNASGSWVSAGDSLGVTIGPSFSWNIFQYGRIKNNIRLQDAIFEESLVNYNKSVLKAVSEVSDSLNGYIYTKRQQEENRKAVEATVRAFNISVIQYNDGLVNYQRLLTTVERLTTTQDRYATIKGALAVNLVLFYKALGGGWQVRKGKSYLSKETADKMKKRVDWDKYLDPEMTKLPKSMIK